MRGPVAQAASTSTAHGATIQAAIRRVAFIAVLPAGWVTGRRTGAPAVHPIREAAWNRRDDGMNRSFTAVDLRTPGPELRRLVGHACFHFLACRMVAHLLADLHRTELRTAHRAEMGQFVRLLRHRLVVHGLRLLRIQAQVELVLPAELEA